MQALFLLALMIFATKGKGTTTTSAPSMPPRLAGPRRQVQGKKRVWFAKDVHDFFGSDRTDVLTTSVFADATGNELVIAFVEYPEAQVHLKDGETIKEKRMRVLFYAAPSSLTKDAISDFLD